MNSFNGFPEHYLLIIKKLACAIIQNEQYADP